MLFFENISVEKQTFRVFLRLRRHDFLIGSLCFGKSTRSTVVKAIVFPILTKLMFPHDIKTILNCWPIIVNHITLDLDLVLNFILNRNLNLSSCKTKSIFCGHTNSSFFSDR